MIGVTRLSVSLNFDKTPLEIGELIISNGKIYFKYNDAFIAKGIELSPIKLPLSRNLYEAPPNSIEGLGGLHGLFSDSLPDGWGKLLLDRALTAKGINPFEITPLDRLAYVGQTGFGTLTYAPKYELGKFPTNTFDLDQMASEISLVYEGASSEIIDELFLVGGSPGGARPKVTIGYNPITDEIIHGALTLPEGYEHWIIKFPATDDWKDIAQIEFAYSEMAKAAGIEMETCKLFKSKSGKHYFGTKRFDRVHNKRLHMHSASGVLEDNFRRSSMDYGHLMDTAFKLERHVKAYEKVLRLAAFNVYSHNKDDHSKNFAFLMNEKAQWKFSPAYDLTFSTSGYGMQSTMVAGESVAPSKVHLMKLATAFSVKNGSEIIDRVKDTIQNWKSFAKNAGVSNSSTQQINKALLQILAR